jgi:acyl dehydratase
MSQTATTPDVTIEVGTKADPRTFSPQTRTDIVRYQGASGDFHPLHHDEVYAKKAGFESIFSVGMLQAGLLATFATDWLGVENLRWFAVRFEEQVWPGDELTCGGVVSGVTELPGGERLITVDLTLTRQTGGNALTGSADFIQP